MSSDFENELKTGFLEEAAQLIVDAEQCFLNLESSKNDPSILEQIFRLAHNLKGSAKAVGFNELGEFTHQLESYLLKLKKGEIEVQGASISLLLRCNDHLQKMIEALKQDFSALTDSTQLLAEIADHLAGRMQSDAVEASPSEELAAVPDASAFETQEAPPSNEGFFSGSSTVATAVAVAEPAPVVAAVPTTAPSAPAAGSGGGSAGAKTDESIRVSLSRVDRLLNFIGEAVILQTVLREQGTKGNLLELRKTVHQMGKVTKEIQDLSMSLRMVPVKQTFQKMQRIVRDTSSSLGKQINFVMQGEETELDKTVLERLGDPLVHLIRNAVDHGVESPEVRLQKGKDAFGKLFLTASHQSGNLVIEIKDDGAGLDPAKLIAKAVEKGILKPGAQLSDREAYNLIFASGFSTKTEVTDVSGRGVGMDVVKTNIEAIQGDIQISTEINKGTTFTIRLPLTLAIIDGMIVKTAQDRFVIPLSHVHESVRPAPEDVHYVSGMGDIYTLRGENFPLYRLSKLLNPSSVVPSHWDGIAIVVRTQAQPFAVLVDDIIGQQQVVIKQLGAEHQANRGFSGSAILGDGRPSLILELPDLVNRAPGTRASSNNASAQRRNAA